MGEGETNEALLAALALATTPGIGPIRFRRIVDRCGSALAASAADLAVWGEAMEIAMEEAMRLHARVNGKEVRAEVLSLVERIRREEVWAVPLGDRGYPPLLARIPDPPPVLFGRGCCPDPQRPAIAVVGSRRASAYGIRQADAFAAGLASAGIPIVSGGARGIDAEAHRAALRISSMVGGGIPGGTVAVLGSGHARPYPCEHRELFAAIVEAGGAVVSEHPPWIEARPEFFPRRNRIISGLSVGVLVIEAGPRSGAGITARLAVEDHDRMAWAVPGRLGDRGSEGTNRAIREGWAACVTGPEDVLDDLGFAGPLLRGAATDSGTSRDCLAGRGPPDPPLGSDESRLLARLRDQGEIPLDAIDDVGDGRAFASLTVLEMLGLVRNREGVVFPNGT